MNPEELLLNPDFQNETREKQELLYSWAVELDMKKDADFASTLGEDGIKQVAEYAGRTFKPKVPGKESVTLTDEDRQRFEQAKLTPVNAVAASIGGALAGGISMLGGLPGMILGALGGGKIVERILRGNGEDDEIKYAYWLGEKAATGDADAIKEIKGYQIQKEITSQSLLGKAYTLGKDAFEFIALGDKELDVGLKRKERENITEYLYRQLPVDEQAQVKGAINTMGAAVSWAEIIGLSMATGGTAAYPGLLTKGIYAGVAEGIKTGTGLTRLFFKGAASFGIESLVSGAVSALQTMPEDLQAGKYNDPNNYFANTAKSFGAGVAVDMAFSLLMDVARVFVRPAVRVLVGKPLDQAAKQAGVELSELVQAGDENTIRKAFAELLDGKISPETMAQLDADGKRELMDIAARTQSLTSGKVLKMDSDEFVPIFGKAAGFDVERKGSQFIVSRNGVIQETLEKRADAINWISSHKKLQIVPSELVEYAGQNSAKIVARVRGKVNIDELSTDTLTSLTMGTDSMGRTSSRNVAVSMRNLLKRSDSKLTPEVLDGIKHTTINEDTFRRNVQNIPDLLKRHPDTIYVPKTMNDPSTKQMFGNYLTAFGKNKTSAFGDLPKQYAQKISITSDGLAAVAKNLDNGSFVRDSDSWLLKYTDLEGKPVESRFFDLDQSNIGVNEALVRTGRMDETEIIDAIYDQYGVSIKTETDKDLFSVYVAKDSRDGIIATGSSVADLVRQRPNLSPRFPARLGPQFYFLDKLGTVDIQRTVATGPFSDLIKLADNFEGNQVKSAWKVLETTENGKVQLSTTGKFTNRYAVTMDDVGFSTEFGSMKAAKKFMSEQNGGWLDTKLLAQSKGFDLATTGNGKIGLTNFEGTQTVVNNLEEAKLALQRAPTAQSHKNLMTALSDPIDDEMINNTRMKLEEIPQDEIRPKWMGALDNEALASQKEALKPNSLKNFLDEVISPSYSAVEQMGKRTGLPELPWKMEQYSIRSRTAAAHTLIGNRIVNSIFSPGGKMIDRKVADVLGEVLQVAPDKWADKAAMLSFTLKDEHIKMLNGARAYLNRLGDVFGIDAYRWLTDYVPKMRRSISELIAENGIEHLTRNSILDRSFGKSWRGNKEVSFFAKNMRNETFLDVIKNQTNIVDQLAFYTEHGYRELHLGKFFSGLDDWYETITKKAGGLDPAIADRIQEFYNVASGHSRNDDWLTRAVSMKSYQLSTAFAKGVEAIFGDKAKPLVEWAKRQITTDLPGKASAMVTHATLNFRPFRAVANLFQYVNTYGVFGNRSLDVIKKITDADVEKMFKKGIITQNVYAMTDASKNSFTGILEKGLKGQQQSEYLTRAWTARCAEDSFDEALERFANGTIDYKKFLSESRMNIMDDTAIDTVTNLLREGKPEAARDLFATQSVRILMFDYAKENYPMAFKGVVGRMFGKFGVYPVGQVDLYRRVLRSGSAEDKIVNGARLLMATTVVYNAFRMAGVDYSGFQAGDAFGFSGGPLYKTGQDILGATDSGPQGQMARRSLARNFLPGVDAKTGAFEVPRLVMPGALQINSMFKATKMIDDDKYRAALTFFGAPLRKDWLRNGFGGWDY